MNTKLKALAALSLVVAGLTVGQAARAADQAPNYISPGIGTLFLEWLSLLR